MKRKIEITVGNAHEALDRFEAAWERARKGAIHGAEVRLTFESLPLLLRNLTPARWQLLERLKAEGPLSINELAKRLERNYKNVHTEVSRLVELGLIQREKDQRVAVAWDVVTAEMRLAA